LINFLCYQRALNPTIGTRFRTEKTRTEAVTF
jgi:hypothetical protein